MLTPKEFAALRILINEGEKYGLELMRESDGVLKRGIIYVLLERMTDKGYVESRQEDNPTLPEWPRRLYKPTSLGQRAYKMSVQAKLDAGEEPSMIDAATTLTQTKVHSIEEAVAPLMEEQRPFRKGETVLHKPTGEMWVLAEDERNGHVVACARPSSSIPASNCLLLIPVLSEVSGTHESSEPPPGCIWHRTKPGWVEHWWDSATLERAWHHYRRLRAEIRSELLEAVVAEARADLFKAVVAEVLNLDFSGDNLRNHRNDARAQAFREMAVHIRGRTVGPHPFSKEKQHALDEHAKAVERAGEGKQKVFRTELCGVPVAPNVLKHNAYTSGWEHGAADHRPDSAYFKQMEALGLVSFYTEGHTDGTAARCAAWDKAAGMRITKEDGHSDA